MSIIWNEIYDDGISGLYQVGGYFVSPLLGNGDSYDLYSDLNGNRPTFAQGSWEDAFVYARVCTQVVSNPPITNVFKGFPPRRDYGILTIGANPAYILERKFIEYPFQTFGIYDPKIGITYPDEPIRVPALYQDGNSIKRLEKGAMPKFPSAGSVFSLYSDYPDLTLRVRGALVVYPADTARNAYMFVNCFI